MFHLSLYFSPNNKVTFGLSVLLTIALYHSLKKIPLTLFYVFFTLLPFAKGKGIDIILLDKKYILKNALFNIDYLFPIYFSTIYFITFYLHHIRQRIGASNKRKIALTKTTLLSFFVFSLFILSTTVNSFNHIFSIPILLSSLQLVIMLFIFFMPFIVIEKKDTLRHFPQVIASSIIFQSVWLNLQTMNKGYLGRDIEVILPGFEFGVRSTENYDLMRMTGTFFESSILGTFLLTNLAVLLFIIANNKINNQREKKVYSVACALGIFSILLTGSRAIYLVTILLFSVILQAKGLLSKKGIDLGINFVKQHKIIIPIMIAGAIFITPYLINRLGSANQLFTKEGSGTYRIELTRLALRLTSNVPFFGVGLNLSPYYLATSFPHEDYFVDPAHPHNLIVQILTETGIVGLTLFTCFIYSIAKPIIKNNFKLNEYSLAALIFFLLAQIYPIFINQMEIISYFFVFLGLTAYYNQQISHEDR